MKSVEVGRVLMVSWRNIPITLIMRARHGEYDFGHAEG
jgi:hypothetical protein